MCFNGVLRVKITVSSFQMALICVPNIIKVKMENNKASKIKNRSSTTVAGGEKVEHSRHSCLIQDINCFTARTIA